VELVLTSHVFFFGVNTMNDIGIVDRSIEVYTSISGIGWVLLMGYR
jgi:hypothetical protein